MLCRSKKARQVWLMLLAFGMLFTCGMQTSAKTVLTFVGHWKDADLADFTRYANEYMALHPDIEIQHVYAEMWGTTGMNKLLVMSAGGDAPDIFHTYLAVAPELFAGGMMAPMPDDMVKEAQSIFLSAVLPGLSYKGKLYGIPTENQTYALGWNERLFQESGLSRAPQNWAELRAMAGKLRRVSDDGKVQRLGLTIDGGTGYIYYVHSLLSLIWSNNGEYVDANGKVRLMEQPVIDTLEFLADMAKTQSFGLDKWIGNGSAAMSIIAPWRLQGYKKDVEWENMRTTLIPHGAGSYTAYQYGWGLFVSAQSKHQKEAWDFLHWYTMEKTAAGSTRLSNFMVRMGSLPTNKFDITRSEYRTEPFFKGFIDSLNVSRPEAVLPEMPARQVELFNLTKNAVLGQESVVSALEKAKERIEQILANAMKKQ